MAGRVLPDFLLGYHAVTPNDRPVHVSHRTFFFEFQLTGGEVAKKAGRSLPYAIHFVESVVPAEGTGSGVELGAIAAESMNTSSC